MRTPTEHPAIKHRFHQLLNWSLAALSTLSFATASAQVVSPEKLRPFVEVVLPEGAAPADTPRPVVLFLQGTGGSNMTAELWTGWFNSLGLATVIIDSAKARGGTSLQGVPSYTQSRDISAALEVIRDDPRIDLSRYAIMGFSKGGTAAMESGGYLKSGQPLPQFVFSLYPGNAGSCPNAYEDPVKVIVLYGELDDWGTYQNNREACKRMAESRPNTSFHLLAGAHHGFDDMVNADWSCCGQSFTSKSSAKATNEARQIVMEAIRAKWLENIKQIRL